MTIETERPEVTPEDHRIVSAAAAVIAARLDPHAVLLVLDSSVELAELCRAVHPGPVLAATHAREVCEQITTRTGRADAIVTTRQARAAVRAVRRGGSVCLPWADVDPPSVTELVQREVQLFSSESLVEFMAVYGDEVGRCLSR